MTEIKETFKIVIAGAKDVTDEVERVKELIKRFNNADKSNNIGLECMHWTDDSYPAFHNLGAQGQIDEELKIQSADIFIGLFNKVMGTPTLGSRSGTEHEVKQAIESFNSNQKPEIKLYFRQIEQSDINQFNDEESKQWVTLNSFKKEMYPKGVIGKYVDLDDLTMQIAEHLYRYRVTKIYPQSEQISQTTFSKNQYVLPFLEKYITNKYKNLDEIFNLQLNENLYFVAKISLEELGQIFRIYFSFECEDGIKRWIGFTNLFPCDFKVNKQNLKENTQGINTSSKTDIDLCYNINELIMERFPNLNTLPIKIDRVRYRADKEIQKNIEFSFGILEKKRHTTNGYTSMPA